MDTDALDYELPESLIAQYPAEPRDTSRLMVVDRASGTIRVDVFANLAAYLRPGDLLVLNDTRVIRARVHARKTTGGEVELFLLTETEPGTWIALARPSSRLRPGMVLQCAGDMTATLVDRAGEGKWQVRFSRPDVVAWLERQGEIPLPPYIRRDHPEPLDAERYQTVYAARPGAVAAPTAGLHFTDRVFRRLEERGVDRVFITLHVGYGTFKPIKTAQVEAHRVDPESYEVSPAAAAQLNAARQSGGRVVAVGTTACRTLETVCDARGVFHPGQGLTDLYIYPSHVFRGVDALQTNFHLPKSSLLALVCAFAGYDLVMEAYRLAVRERFRFYSYGDAMLIL
ncbi:MAG: tRNA preQ1(34) S-adenosylmethionine ribosyltransferase-isomerase QueA [Candidatus Hydrogenedentes bacterium]|nr:tRNA preQ1(34) S-adenosylmethionine ribosyltransferase-isomerase QueA [Candidatus Hydrogenedentota bacterium]